MVNFISIFKNSHLHKIIFIQTFAPSQGAGLASSSASHVGHRSHQGVSEAAALGMNGGFP